MLILINRNYLISVSKYSWYIAEEFNHRKNLDIGQLIVFLLCWKHLLKRRIRLKKIESDLTFTCLDYMGWGRSQWLIL